MKVSARRVEVAEDKLLQAVANYDNNPTERNRAKMLAAQDKYNELNSARIDWLRGQGG